MSMIKSRLVFDGTEPIIPPEMGVPAEHQFQGTPHERTAELCGRVCYGSLGTEKSRGSKGYHKHIHDVAHLSVYEHTPLTVQFHIEKTGEALQILLGIMNRPGVWTHYEDGTFRVTANFRAMAEWVKRTDHNNDMAVRLGRTLELFGHMKAPMIVVADGENQLDAALVTPVHDQEKWITVYMCGSRGFSHEQVRHGDWTAISQRSTRFVDESGSNWIWHPMLMSYLDDKRIPDGDQKRISDMCKATVVNCDKTYDELVKVLQPYARLLVPDIDKLSARKQARGTARGFLGNALQTELLFSASVAQWHWMFDQRASRWADAEIRQMYAAPDDSVIEAVLASQYADDFAKYKRLDAPDSIGWILELE